jgi:hypothetical protein
MKHNEANKHTKLHQVSDTFHLPKLESSKQQAALCECAAVSCISEVARTASSAHPTGTWLLWLWIVWPEAHLGHPLDIFRHHGEIYKYCPSKNRFHLGSVRASFASEPLRPGRGSLEKKTLYIDWKKCWSFWVISSRFESFWVMLSQTESYWVVLSHSVFHTYSAWKVQPNLCLVRCCDVPNNGWESHLESPFKFLSTCNLGKGSPKLCWI